MENSTRWLSLGIIAAIAVLSAISAVVPIFAQTDNQTTMTGGNATNATMNAGNMTAGNATDGKISRGKG